MRTFSPKYISKMMNVYDFHFVARKQKVQFKLKAQVGHFIINTRAVAKEVNILLKYMNFKFNFI